jgi:hypothetical protein
MTASCQAAKEPLALIFCARLAVWGAVTVTVKAGLAALADLAGSAAHTMPTAAAHNPRAAHTPTLFFFMTFLFAMRPAGASEV